MWKQIRYGIELYLNNFLFLAMITLPIVIPSNLLVEYLTYWEDGSLNQFRMVSLIQFAVSAFLAGAVITSLRAIALKEYRSVELALGYGWKYWLAVAGTSFVANLISVFALLLFVIPGVFCLVRFALIDIVVVLEDCHGSIARQRSWDLTRKCAWAILLLTCIFQPMVIVVAALPGVIAAYVDLPDAAIVTINVIFGTASDLLLPLMTSILFSFYWHAAGGMLETDVLVADELAETPVEPDDDLNPFKSPQAT